MPILTDGEGTAIRVVGNNIYLDVDAVEATMVDSTGATGGHVLTADGSGGASWQAQTGGLAAADIDTLAELNAIVGDATLVDEAHTHTASDVTDFRSSVGEYVDAVSGGAGFVDVSGAVSLDLDTGRAFHHTMTGNITSLAFASVPTDTEYETSWTLVLKIDATGGYTLAGTPTVTWLDGSSWSDIDLTANAVNILQFVRIGSTTYATLVYNGDIPLDPYKVCFLADETVTIVTEAEDVDVASDTTDGDGTITYEKNGVGITTRTTFTEGDVLSVICTGLTTTTAVRIPRYA